MAKYTITHPDLPDELNGTTSVETVAGPEAALDMAAAHVAGILRHRGIRVRVEPEDVRPDITVTEEG